MKETIIEMIKNFGIVCMSIFDTCCGFFKAIFEVIKNIFTNEE